MRQSNREKPIVAPPAAAAHAAPTPPVSRFRYAAFISYSHKDSQIAAWLHRALEQYRVPARLVGQQTPVGIVPRALGRCFRDRDELPASADLKSQIVAALDDSAVLIVICSKASAASIWVNQEIITFKQRRDAGRVIALIVDGEPFAADSSEECFPPALRFELDSDGRLSPSGMPPYWPIRHGDSRTGPARWLRSIGDFQGTGP